MAVGVPAMLPAELLEAFAAFDVLDRGEETADFRGVYPDATVDATWDRWHRLSFGRFLAYARGIRAVGDLRRAAAVTGSLGLALRIVHCLQEAGVVSVGPGGELEWQLDFPVVSVPPAGLVDEVARRLEQPAVDHLGQCAVNPAATVRRAERIVADLRGNELGLAFLGDVDLVSALVAAAVPVPVFVVELDGPALATLDDLAGTFGLANLTVRKHDLAEPLPDAMRGAASAVVMDPIDSGTAVSMWLARAQEALVGEMDDAIYLSINTRRLGGRRVGLAGHASDLGFAIDEMHTAFHEWPVPAPGGDQHTRQLAGGLTRLGLSVAPGEFMIFTDLLVMRRLLDGPVLWPQDHAYVRRSI